MIQTKKYQMLQAEEKKADTRVKVAQKELKKIKGDMRSAGKLAVKYHRQYKRLFGGKSPP